MTKKLVDLFELPDSTQEVDTSVTDVLPLPLEDYEISTETLSSIEKIEAALPQVRGLTASDTELDSIADLAIASYKDLMDLGMQVDSRFSSEIFAVGGTMLGHALTAKTAKVNKKLKMIELQIKKAQLDQKAAQKEEEVRNTPLGEGRAIDRNELLRMFADKRKQ